jgi:hypothetical protein
MVRGRSRLVRGALALAVLMFGAAAPTVLAKQVVPGGPVTPDPAFLQQLPGEPCTPETPYEQNSYGTDAAYGDDCTRIRFAFGPLSVKPGQNDALLQPVTIEKPAYDGYIVRFKPDIARALDGSKPNTEHLHLHHATWLNLGDSYGDGPFFAAGEEKTIANFPKGYGMQVGGDDQWGLLYMIHNALTTPDVLYITYEIDYVAADSAAASTITPVKPLWLDVQKKAIAEGAPETSSNPVFNVQRGYGHIDETTGRRVCSWPDENCAQFDMYGGVTPQQGLPIDEQIEGADYRVPASMAGTIVGLGGHLHPGGLRDEVSLVRNVDGAPVEKPIFTSDALYWDFEDPTKVGGPPHSWDMAMTVTGAPLGWKVKIAEVDIIRLNAVYDSDDASWYENMGIVVAYVATDDPIEPAGVDVFAPDVEVVDGIPTTALTPPGNWLDGWTPPSCTPDLEGLDGMKTLCLRGQVTHGAVPESANGGDPCGEAGCKPLTDKAGPVVSEIRSVGFTYGEADMGVIETTGLPTLERDKPARFWSYDSAAKVWHTFTRCALPCTGGTLMNYPIANGGAGVPGDTMDFESMEIGFGLFWEPAKSQLGGSKQYDEKWLTDGVYWEFTPKEAGTFAFYCRIHPGMRGAFRVV